MPLPTAEFRPSPPDFHNYGDTFQVMLAWIAPADYISAVMRSRGIPHYDARSFVYNSPVIDRLRVAMVKRLPIEVPFLEIDDAVITEAVPYGHYRQGFKLIDANPMVRITAQEGLNRNRVALELEIPYTPCRFLLRGLKNWDEYEKIWERPDIEAKILRYLDIHGKVVKA